MKIITRVLTVLAFAGWTGSVTAASIGPVDIISADGKEWAQVDLFTGLSWNDIEAVCPAGDCDAGTGDLLNGWSVEGYLWASIDQVQSLFNAYTGQATSAPGDYREENSTWAPSFLQDFNLTETDAAFDQVVGWSSTAPVGSFSYIPGLFDRSLTFPGDDVAITNNFAPRGSTDPGVGAWFIRNATQTQVPAPATLTLFGLGLASMWMSRRKRVACY